MSSSEFDTGLQHLASVYAKALLGAAQQGAPQQSGGQVDVVLDEFSAVIGEVLDRNPELESVLVSPRLDEQEKAALIDRIFGGRVSEVLLNFFKVMARHGRLDCLRATQKAAVQLHNEVRGRREVFVKTAAPISAETVELIAARLRTALNANVEMQLEVDPEMIGGLVVRVGDTVFDGSVANQLARFREDALAKATVEMRASLNRFLASA